MKVFISSLTKDSIGQRLFRFHPFLSVRIGRTALYVLSTSCILLACASLMGQELAASSSKSDSGNDSSSASEAMAAPGCSGDAAVDADCDMQSAQKSLPNAPPPQSQPVDQPAPQTKRILGLIPNFRAVSTDAKLPPQTVKDKFMETTQDSFDYSSIVTPALLAAYSMGTDATPEFRQGAAGYARYFWHAAVDQTSENYMVEFIVPVITHEDTRYYTLGRGGFLKRAGYALSRSVITRSDDDREVFNISEVVGSGAAAGLSSLYYPTRERSFANTGSQWGLDIGVDAASFVAREFWPDINHWLFHGAKPSAVIQHQ